MSYNEDVGGYVPPKVIIQREDDAMSPREFDNVGRMVCWHRRYKLGDEQPKCDPAEWLADFQKDEPSGIILPLYLIDHGGISISTHAFSCPWDSGQVGYIVTDLHRLQTMGFDWKCLTPKRRVQVIEMLKAEVKAYDAYLQGDVWGYSILDGQNGECLDSCGGFLGETALEDMKAHSPRRYVEFFDAAWNERN